jgi:dipeptidase
MLLVGKKASVNGSVLSAHNDDLQGNHASLYEILERKTHTRESFKGIKSDRSMPLTEETQRCLILKTWRGYGEGDAVAINENMVSIAGGVDLGVDRNQKAAELDPLIDGGVSGEARYRALQSSKSARECVCQLGEMYSKYGVSYPSGVGVADADECWYMEAGGGSSWAAIRVPDDSCLIQGNGYRIREVDPSDKKNYICSEGLLDFSRASGLWDPSKGEFDFSRIFGGHMATKPDTQYLNTRRVWAAVMKLSPSSEWAPDLDRFPLFIKPDDKLTPMHMMSILRDSFDNTEFEINPDMKLRNEERPIAVPSCVHTDVIELRGWLPAAIGGVIWGGIGSPNLTTYIPYYFGIDRIAAPFATGGPEYDECSAFWKYRALSSLVLLNYREYIKEVQNSLSFFEKKTMEDVTRVENKLLEGYEDEQAIKVLSDFTSDRSKKSLELIREIYGSLQTRVAKEMHLIFSRQGLEW